MVTRHNLGSRGQPELSRQSILEAALQEFAARGVAGARIDAIAHAAGVNKSLLYYYFGDKEDLYGAVLDRTFEELTERLHDVLDRPLPPGEKLMSYVGTHFDFIAAHPLYPRLVQHELMRAGAGGSPHLEHIVERYFRPTMSRLAVVLQEGSAAGEFRSVQPHQFLMSIVAVIVFYFSNTPIARAVRKVDPLSREMLAERRIAVLDFIAAAIFRDPQEAQRVLSLPHIAQPAFMQKPVRPGRNTPANGAAITPPSGILHRGNRK